MKTRLLNLEVGTGHGCPKKNIGDPWMAMWKFSWKLSCNFFRFLMHSDGSSETSHWEMCSVDPVKMTPAWSYEWQELEGYLGAMEMHRRKRKCSPNSCLYLLSLSMLSNVTKIREKWGIWHEMRNGPTHSSNTWRRKPSLEQLLSWTLSDLKHINQHSLFLQWEK